MSDKRVELVNAHGDVVSIPADDKVDINQHRARGFRTKSELSAQKQVEKKPEGGK
jgi:hypothetical protein